MRAGTLEALSPLKVLSRGYAIARDGRGHVIATTSAAKTGDAIDVLVSDGSIQATVTGIERRQP